MTENLFLVHWLATFFIALMWCVERFFQRWTGYRFVYRLYAGLPLLVVFTIVIQSQAPLVQVPGILASLSVANTVPASVSHGVNSLLWIWLSGSALLLGGLLWQWLALVRLSGRRTKIGSMAGLVSGAVTSPCLKGILRPVILLPENYREQFSAQQLELILAHERVHARRLDNLWNLLALGLRALFWFNPLIWVGYHRFRLVQELSCDETVLAGQPGDVPFAYARALLAASTGDRSKILCTNYGDKKMMLTRMNSIKSARLVSRGAQRLVLALVIVFSATVSAIAAPEAPTADYPKAKTWVNPKYPRAAFEAKAEAEVILEFNIDADGIPHGIRVIENTAPEAYREGFNKAAVTSLEQWRYQPSDRIRKNVRTKISFKLSE